MSIRLISPVSLVILAVFAPSGVHALDLANFRICVSSSGSGSTCTLDPNWSGGTIIPWDITGSPIAVQRAVTLQGNTSYPGQVTLKRMAAIANIMYISSAVAGATVNNLVFDGNRASYTGGSYVDLDVQNGSWNNYITNSTFKNAPDYSINVNYYTYIQYCNFYDAKYVGVLTFNTYANNTDIGIYTSYFTRAGTNAVYMQSGAVNSIIYDTDFYENHNTCAWSSNGGQILLDATTSGITVQNNDVDGNYAYCSSYPQSTAGLEGYGSSHNVTGNTFKRHRWFGVYFTAASNISITSNIVESNYTNGVNLSGTDGSMPCSSSPAYTINYNTVRYNSWYGIYASKNGCSAGPSSSTISLTGNSFTGNGLGTTSLNNP